MSVFENYKNLKGKSEGTLNGKKYSVAYDNKKVFSKVYHITHLPASKYLLESTKILPQLIQDKSKLNTERIKVIWLSPNTWYDGSLYGNIQLSFDFKQIIEGKKFYGVEVMSEYKPHACRILISNKDYDTNPLLEPYNPFSEYDGPWHIDSKGDNYYHKEYNIEFMLEGELLLEDASEIDFVNHHKEFCNMNDYGECKYLGSSRDLAKMLFVSHLIANDIKLKNLNLYLIKDDHNLWSELEIATVIDHIVSRLRRNQIFEANESFSPLTKAQICKSILDLVSKENYDGAVILSKTFASMDDLVNTLRNVFGAYFKVESSSLDTNELMK